MTINRAVKEHLRQITDAERGRTVRFLVRARVVAAFLFTAVISVYALKGTPDARATLPIFIAYIFVSALIVAAVERWPAVLRWSSYSIGLLDVPMMLGTALLALRYVAPPEDPRELLPTLLPYLPLAIVFSVLSLDFGAIALATVMAAVGGAVVTYVVIPNVGVAFDPLLANTVVGALGAFVVSRIRNLVEESRRKDFAGKYILGESIGSGGMAEVFAATYSPAGSFERRVAVKRVLPAFAKNEEFIALFRREAELGSHLAHPNIVQVLDFGRHLDSWFIAMEYIEGVSLAAVMSREPLPLPAALYVVAEVAEGLAYLHERPSPTGEGTGLVHRDLNPPNVLLSLSGEVKVSDFGVARWRDAGEQLTRTGTVRGKLSYMAPEYLSHAPPSALGDLYSLGVMAHELVTGRRLYSGKSEAEIAHLLLNVPVAPPSTSRPDVPHVIDALIGGLLERDPAMRTQSARAVTRVLRELSADLAPYPQGRALLVAAVGAAMAADATPAHAPRGTATTQPTQTRALPPPEPARNN